MTEEMKEKLQTTQPRMMRMTTQTKNNSAAAHSANVDEAVDDEPRDTEIVSEEGTTEANAQDPLEKDESNQRRRQQFHLSPKYHWANQNTNWSHALEHVVCATHAQDDLLAVGIQSWILGQSRKSWKQAGMIAEHHDCRWTKTHL